MKTAIYIGTEHIRSDERLVSLVNELENYGCETYFTSGSEALLDGTDMLLSVGGDGTFLSSSRLAAVNDIPVMGVNFGRMGFLSENRSASVVQALLSGEYSIENRVMLKADVVTGNSEIDEWPFALNEFTVHRNGAAMLGVDVTIDGGDLPTYCFYQFMVNCLFVECRRTYRTSRIPCAHSYSYCPA